MYKKYMYVSDMQMMQCMYNNMHAHLHVYRILLWVYIVEIRVLFCSAVLMYKEWVWTSALLNICGGNRVKKLMSRRHGLVCWITGHTDVLGTMRHKHFDGHLRQSSLETGYAQHALEVPGRGPPLKLCMMSPSSLWHMDFGYDMSWYGLQCKNP